MAQDDDSKDHFYTQKERYGDENVKLRRYNRDIAFSGFNGYPSDSEYMEQVSKAGHERDMEHIKNVGSASEAHYANKAHSGNVKNRKPQIKKEYPGV